VADLIRRNCGELDDGSLEFADEPQGDFVVLTLAQEHPGPGLGRNVRQIAQSKALGWTVRQFAVHQPIQHVWQNASAPNIPTKGF